MKRCSIDRDDENPAKLAVNLPEGRALKLEAPNAADAEKWIGALHDSIAILSAVIKLHGAFKVPFLLRAA